MKAALALCVFLRLVRRVALCACLVFMACSLTNAAEPPAGRLASGEYFIKQSWSQEQDFSRPYHVGVPRNAGTGKLPVFIYLHGNGGDARGSMNGFMKRHPTMAAGYVMVFPDGYLKSWNISAERSKADDRKFIEAIVERLSAYENVQRDNFTIMGNSNGAALANQMAIESQSPNIRNYITAVSPLNVLQHDGARLQSQRRRQQLPDRGRSPDRRTTDEHLGNRGSPDSVSWWAFPGYSRQERQARL